jgi:hypothetical protein
MPKIINISFYGAPGEKNLNEFVAMRSEETCPDCKNGFVERDGLRNQRCHRCHGDGNLTNLISFCPEAPACASNYYTLGTWLKIRYSLFNGTFPEIIVIVTDRMAKCLNSNDGKYEFVCKECKSKFINQEDYMTRTCCNKQRLIQTRDIDLTYGSFEKLAPHSVGLIQCEVSVWKGGKWE